MTEVLLLWITTVYCGPRRTKDADRSEQLLGLYPELAALGLGKGCSPALQYQVARLVALSSSIEAAQLLGVELELKSPVGGAQAIIQAAQTQVTIRNDDAPAPPIVLPVGAGTPMSSPPRGRMSPICTT